MTREFEIPPQRILSGAFWEDPACGSSVLRIQFSVRKEAAGDVDLMQSLGRDLGMEVLVNEPVYVDDMVVSSHLGSPTDYGRGIWNGHRFAWAGTSAPER